MLMPDQALQRGEALIAAGRYREAVQILNQVARTDTPNWQLQCSLAEALIQTDKFKDALNAAQTAAPSSSSRRLDPSAGVKSESASIRG
jgi:Flp pilus assembly protein TadD